MPLNLLVNVVETSFPLAKQEFGEHNHIGMVVDWKMNLGGNNKNCNVAQEIFVFNDAETRNIFHV